MAATTRKARLFRQREQELLEAAAALYREEDWRGVTVERIAARAEIGKGTVYLHFRRKDEVAARLAVRLLKRLAGCWQTIPRTSERGARLRRLLAEARAVAETRPGQLALVPAMLEPPVFGKLQAGIRAELLAALRALLATLHAQLAQPAAEHPATPRQAAQTMTEDTPAADAPTRSPAPPGVAETIAADAPTRSPAPPGVAETIAADAPVRSPVPNTSGWEAQAWLAWCVVQGALLAPAGLAEGDTGPETWLECAAHLLERGWIPA